MGRDEVIEHDLRYDRADEFMDEWAAIAGTPGTMTRSSRTR